MDMSGAATASTTHAQRLLPGARAALDRSTDDRIAMTQTDVWIDYGGAEVAIRAMNDLLARPRSEEMPYLLIAASSRNGKSSLLRKFHSDHTAEMGEGGRFSMPVVRLRMPDYPDPGNFWSAILNAMKVGHQIKATPPVKKDQAQRNLENVRCRMLMIDEIHNILHGRVPEQRHFLALLKNLSSELMMPIVAAGTVDALRALQTEKELGDRFQVVGLPKWQRDRSLRSLLKSLELTLPLREPSGLDEDEIATKLLNVSGGTIGGLCNIVRAAAVRAIRSGEERITVGGLGRLEFRPLRGFDVAGL